MIDLHRLGLLRELAVRGTVTAVAKARDYTPSAVSQQLRTLERELGVALTERRGRNVVLTAAGRALVAEGEEVLRAAERASTAAAAAAAAIGGPVDIGGIASVGATLVPRAVAALRASHPLLEPRFTQCQDEGLRELRLGGLDIWIDQHYSLLPHPDEAHVDVLELLTEPVGLAVPASDDRGPLLAAYRDQPWAGGPPGSACRRLLQRLSDDDGFEPDVRFVTEDLEPTLQLVAAGVAVAVLPRLALARLPDGVHVHPLPRATRRVLALTRSSSRGLPAVQVVLDALRQAAIDGCERGGNP